MGRPFFVQNRFRFDCRTPGQVLKKKPFGAFRIQAFRDSLGQLTMNVNRVKSSRTVFILTRTFRLLMFDQVATGGVLIGEGLPFGKCLCAWSSDEPGHSFALIYRESNRTLILLSIDSARRTVQSRFLTSQRLMNPGKRYVIQGATVHGPELFVIFGGGIECFNIATGTLLESSHTDLPGDWMGQRFFLSLSSIPTWWALSFDGTRIQFEEVPLRTLEKTTDLRSSEIKFVFERRGTDGPYAVSTQGRVFNLSDPTSSFLLSFQVSRIPLQIEEIDTDGSRIVVDFLNPSGAPEFQVMETSNFNRLGRMNPIKKLVEFDAGQLDLGGPLMRRFASVSIRNEQLTLISSRGNAACQFQIRSNRLVITNPPAGSQHERLARDFQLPKLSKDSLRVAEWDDGSRIWIDPRGLLHLRSSDPQIPEASFLLDGNQVAVWTSDGQMHGNQYYIDNGDLIRTISPEEVIERILSPFVSRLR